MRSISLPRDYKRDDRAAAAREAGESSGISGRGEPLGDEHEQMVDKRGAGRGMAHTGSGDPGTVPSQAGTDGPAGAGDAAGQPGAGAAIVATRSDGSWDPRQPPGVFSR